MATLTTEINRLVQTHLASVRKSLSDEGVSDEILDKVFDAAGSIPQEPKERFELDLDDDEIVLVLNYTNKCHALFGDFRKGKLGVFKTTFLEDKKKSGCFYQPAFVFGPGWGFPLNKLDVVKKALKGYNFREVECEELKEELRSEKKDEVDDTVEEKPKGKAAAKDASSDDDSKHSDSESDLSDDEKPQPPKGKKAAPPSDSESDDPPPKSASKSSGKSKVAPPKDDDDDDDEDVPPAKAVPKNTGKSKAAPPKSKSDDEDEDDAPPAKAPSKNAKASKTSVKDEDDEPPAKSASKSKTSKAKDDSDNEVKKSKKSEEAEAAPFKSFTENKWGNKACAVTGIVAMKLPLGKDGKELSVMIGEQDSGAGMKQKGLKSVLPLEDTQIKLCKDNSIKFITPADIQKLKKNKEFKDIANELADIYGEDE